MTLASERLFVAALAGFTLLKMFKGLVLTGYQELPYGFSCSFKCKEKLDKTFLSLYEEALSVNIRGAHNTYPMTMMGDNARSLLEHQGQKALAEALNFPPKALIDMVKFADVALPAPHMSLPRLHIRLLEVYSPGLSEWRVEGAVFEDKEALKEFARLYARRKSFDPFLMAVNAGLVTEEGLWQDAGITLLEEIRRDEELFWRQKGFVRVYGDEKHFPTKSFNLAPLFVNKSLIIKILECNEPRLWACDKTKKLCLEDVLKVFAPLKAPRQITTERLLMADPLGAFYETACVVSSPSSVKISLFGGPLQVLALLLQETGGNLARLKSLKKEMFEFSN